MPKINSQGQPSYAGVSGQVTSATGQQFELDPNKNLDGTEPESAQPEEDRVPVVSLDGPDQLTPSANTDAAAQAEADEDEKQDAGDESEEFPGAVADGNKDEDVKQDDNTSLFGTPNAKSANAPAAKKTANAAKK